MIRPGQTARTRFWRSRTAGEGADLTWCGRQVRVGERIPFELLPPKFQRDDAAWYAIEFLDGEPPQTQSLIGSPRRPLWPYPAMGLVATHA